MKLNLDFSKYKGTTRLKDWWGVVKSHFVEVQNAHNDLDCALENEVTARQQTDNALATEREERIKADNSLKSELGAEASRRNDYDAMLQEHIDTEISERVTADNVLDERISNEISERTALAGRVKAVEEQAHTHANQSVIDEITAERMSVWDSIKEQVTQSQLEEAISEEAEKRIEGDSENKKLFDFLEEICFGFGDEIQRIYSIIGTMVYDGGINEQPQLDVALDGGAFDDEDVGFVDCGCWDIVVSVIDGGGYADVTGNIIDGGGYADTVGNVLDGGNYPN